MSKLFSPTQVGPYKLSHRVVMAPLTRMRSDPGDIPSDLMVEYYTQRASKGGLIISEATPVSIRGYGYAGAPGIYSDTQIAGWRRVTNAVHAKGGRIFLQLWHVGRQSHADLQPNGERAGRAVRDRGRGLCVYQARRSPVLDAARARTARDSRDYRGVSRRAPSARCGPVLTASRFTARTATCPINSSRTAPTSARTNMAAPSKTARASCWR